MKPRVDTINAIYRALGWTTLKTLNPTVDDSRGAVALMRRAITQGEHRWGDEVAQFEARSRNRTKLRGPRRSDTTTSLPLHPRTSLTSFLPDGCFVRVRQP
jgi:hypothetical protein